MLVFYKERLALLSVPKTGSSAYQTALRARADIAISGPTDLKHANMRRYDRFFQTMFRKVCDAEMEVMAVIREPIDWLGSWYRYRSRPERAGHPLATHELSFDDFLNAYMQSPPAPLADVGSQSDFLRPRRSGASADHLFRYENQGEIQAFLEDRLRCEIHLKPENVSPKRPLKLAPDTEKRFRERHAAEFALHQSAR